MRCRRRRRVGLVKKGSEICARRRRTKKKYVCCMHALASPPVPLARAWGRVAAPTYRSSEKASVRNRVFRGTGNRRKKTRQRGEVGGGGRKRAWGISGWRRQAGWRSLLYCGSRCSYCCVIPLLLFLALAWKKKQCRYLHTVALPPPYPRGRSFIN